MRDVRRVRRLVWGSQLEVGRSLENFTPAGALKLFSGPGPWLGLSHRSVRRSVRLPLEKLAIKPSSYLSLWGKRWSLCSTLIMHRNILENIFPPALAAVTGSLVWKIKISCQRTFRARVFNSGSNNFLLICRRQSANYVCWIQNDSFHNPFDALSGLHSPHKRTRRLFIVCLRPRQRREIIQVWISRTTFASCTFV